jgi:2-polyprenyl-6-methoxyphenol hydroxylase-like FAD-dependent oxidoreductase
MRALIVGGGIAGPATALALQQVGVAATVLEARPASYGDVGSYFTVSPNGLDALAAIGALQLAKDAGFATRRNEMVGATGRRLGSVSLGRPLEDGTTALTMKRSRLAALLAEEAARRGIDVRHGSRVAAVHGDEDAVRVELADGTRLDADLLVGADGVHSLVRRTVDPQSPPARYVGLTNFGGITRATGLARELPAEAWHFVFGRCAFFGCHATTSGDVVWFVNVPRGEISREERTATTAEEWRRCLRDSVAGDAGPADALIAAGELELAGDNTYDLGHVPVWHRDRMLVIGDAAHAPSPSSGQGASMALEDAVVLAKAVRDAQDVSAAWPRSSGNAGPA